MLDFRVHVVTWKESIQSSVLQQQGSDPPADPFTPALDLGTTSVKKLLNLWCISCLWGFLFVCFFVFVLFACGCVLLLFGFFVLVWGFGLFCLVVTFDLSVLLPFFFYFVWRRIGCGGLWFCLIVCFRRLNFCFLQLECNWLKN